MLVLIFVALFRSSFQDLYTSQSDSTFALMVSINSMFSSLFF
nr:MAG TPA: hypothetical protein [Bacteriophage sp.]